MNLISRQDRLLVVGLVAALLIVFSRQVRYLVDLARDVEQTSGVSLVLPLVILTIVFIFHQQAKRQEAKAHAAAAQAESHEARARAAELERLVAFGQTLGRSLDVDAIRDAMLQHLEELAGTRDVRVITRRDGHWQMLIEGHSADKGDPAELIGKLVDRGLMTAASGDPIAAEGCRWWPMVAGGDVVGLVGVPVTSQSPTPDRDRVLETAATLLGISVRTAELFREVRESSLKDGLTGCFNRTHAVEVIDIELRRARRSRLPLSLIMFDIDRFKQINDRYGHLGGDAVLATVGQLMRDLLRGSDLKCRYGGDEFLVLLPDTPMEGARRVADTLLRGFADRPIRWQNQALTITASFGVTSANAGETDSTAFIERADAALYRAKDEGRNCVCLSSQPAVA